MVFTHSGQWNHLNKPELGFMNFFSEDIKTKEIKYPGLLPDIRKGSVLFVGSDYSGQHNFAKYESLSFLFADLENCGNWEFQRTQLRKRFFSDNRRISYKALNDRKRRQALIPFLDAANTIPGLVVTILIDKNIGSLFSKDGIIRTNSPELKDYSHWNSVVFEKLLRVVHIVSLFVAGLSRPHQDLFWFTDEDAIVANEERLRELVNIFANVSGHYLSHDLRHLRIGTTKSDTGKRDIEDLVAVADLVAGTLSRTLTEYSKSGGMPIEGLFNLIPENIPDKTRELVYWFSDKSQPLKRLVYIIDEDQSTKQLNLRFWQFHRIMMRPNPA